MCAAVKAPGFGDRRKAMLEDIAILTGGKVITEDIGVKLENVGIDWLGQAKKVVIDKDNTTIVEGQGKAERHPGPDQADPGPDRGDDLRLRPREAPGAAGQDGRRRRPDQGRRGHRDRAQGEEGPGRGRHARDQGGRRGGHRARRRRGPAPLPEGARKAPARGRHADRRQHRQAGHRGAAAPDRDQRRLRRLRGRGEGQGDEGRTSASTP